MDLGILRSVSRRGGGPATHLLVRAARSGLGLSLLDLARLSGVSVSTVRRIEGGEVDDPAATKVRQALQAAGAQFVDIEGVPGLLFGNGAKGPSAQGPAERPRS